MLLLLLPSQLIFSQKEESWAGLSGYVYGDYFYNILRDTSINSLPDKALSGAKDLNGFQIRKIYFTYNTDISEKFSARFRLNAEPSTVLPNGKLGVSVKDAYLKWKNIFHGSDFYFGLQPTPAFHTIADFWRYKLLADPSLDLRGMVNSRDLGVSLKGKLDDEGVFNYWFMIGNGSSNADFDKYKRIYAHLHLIPINPLKIILYGDVKFRPKVDYQVSYVNSGKMDNNIYTTDLFIGYAIENSLRIGIESYIQKIPNDYYILSGENAVYKTKNTFGFSVFQVYSPDSSFDIIGRYDRFDANLNSDSKGDSRNYFLFGVSYKLNHEVSVTPNILVETYERSAYGRYYTTSVTARITFFYSYHE